MATRATRTHMVPPRPLLVRLAKTFAMLPLHALGLVEDTEEVSIKLIDKWVGKV